MQENKNRRSPSLVGQACAVALCFAVALTCLLLRSRSSDSASAREIVSLPANKAVSKSVAPVAATAEVSHREEAARQDDPIASRDRPGAVSIPNETEVVQSKAHEYYVRDHEALRRSFLAGRSGPLTGAQLGQMFEFENGVDKDALAVVVEAQTVATQARLDVLADEYMAILDGACDAALTAGPSDVVNEADWRSIRRQDGDLHRLLVHSDDSICVFRLRADDPERVERLRRESQDLIEERERMTVETLTSITGEMPTRRVIADPFHKNKNG